MIVRVQVLLWMGAVFLGIFSKNFFYFFSPPVFLLSLSLIVIKQPYGCDGYCVRYFSKLFSFRCNSPRLLIGFFL